MANKRALAYLLTVKFVRSALGFSLFTAAFTSLLMIYGLLTLSGFAGPLLDRSFDWSVFINPLATAVFVSSFVYAILSTIIYRSTRLVRLSDSGVELESGILFKKINLIPYSRIKHIEHKQSPLQKLMNFATLSIDYGGWNPRQVEHIAEDKALLLQHKLTKVSSAGIK